MHNNTLQHNSAQRNGRNATANEGCVCVCAVRAGRRVCVRGRVCVCVCTSSSSVTISLSLSLRAGYQELASVTKKVTEIQGPLLPPEIFVNPCHSNVTVVTGKDLRGGSHRWRLHRKGGLGPVGVATVGQRKGIPCPSTSLESGPSSPPSCPLGKPEGVLEGGDSGPGGPDRQRPGSRGAGHPTRRHASKVCHRPRFTPENRREARGSVPDLSPPRPARPRQSGSETRSPGVSRLANPGAAEPR